MHASLQASRSARLALAALLTVGGVSVSAGIATGQEHDPASDLRPTVEITAECDPATGHVLWMDRWTNDSDVVMTFDIDYYRFSTATEEGPEFTDLSWMFPTTLEPGETVTMGPELLPDHGRFWSIDFAYWTSTELSDEPVGSSSMGIAHDPCPQPGEDAAPPVHVPRVEPRFTG